MKFNIKHPRHILFTLGILFISYSTALAQDNNFNLLGKVIDEKTQFPLGGASIEIKGAYHEVTAGNDGEFIIKTETKFPFVIIVKYVGYETKEVTVINAQKVIVGLSENTNKLNEVVVVGYGTQRKSDLTGSVATVAKDNLTKPTSSFDNLLQGAVAGVVVSQNSGQPGATSTIRIRGGNSLSFGNDPLYVIDGFIYYNDNSLTNLSPGTGTVPSVTGVSSNGLSTINPSDIESIDILKDAAATAIYGSRGANGVVIITTKRGAKNSNNISYSTSYGIQKVAKTLSVLNGPQWADLFDDLYNATPAIQAGLAANKKLIDSLGAAGVNGDWVNSALRTGVVQNHQLTIYGGDETSRYSVSGNYFDQKGIVLGTDFKRYSARFNYEKNVFKSLRVATSIFGSNSAENKLTGAAYNGIGFSNAFSSLHFSNPLQTIYNHEGTYNTKAQPAINPTLNTISGQQFSDNAIQDITSTINQTKLFRVLGNISAEYKVTDALTLKSTFGADLLNTKLNYYAPSYTALGNNAGTITGSGSVGTINYLSWLNENTITYDHSFEKQAFFKCACRLHNSIPKRRNCF